MKTPRYLIPLCLFASLCGAFCSTGCDDADEDDDTLPRATQQTDGTEPMQASNGSADPDADAGSIELVTVSDPKEGAFTVDLPKGWQNQVALVRAFGQTRTVVTALHPDGQTLLFFGDPKMPTFSQPLQEFKQFNAIHTLETPLSRFSPYQTAAPFFTRYLKQRFGSKPGFRITKTAPNPALEQQARERARKYGVQPTISTTLITFDYQDKGKPVHVLVNGMTMRMGTVWNADISGVSTVGDPQAYNDLLWRIASSSRPNKEWQARESARSAAEHQQRMAMIENNGRLLTMRHEQNMTWIRNSSAQHQARMDALHAAGDAQMANWKAQQDSQDFGHQQFVNTIKGEETVVNSSGQEFQVQSGAGRYYRNTNSNTYIGTHSTVDQGDLRSAWGLNPDNYEEVKIKRR